MSNRMLTADSPVTDKRLYCWGDTLHRSRPKIVRWTLDDAQEHADRLVADGLSPDPSRLHTYPCEAAGRPHWHVGHRSPRFARRLAAAAA